MNNTTWALDSLNPDSNGETFNYRKWASFATDANSDIEQDWRDKTGAATADEYMGSRPYKLSLGTTYSESTKSDELTVLWTQLLSASRQIPGKQSMLRQMLSTIRSLQT